MKKWILVVMCCFLGTQAILADRNGKVTDDVTVLPASAQTFIKKYFKNIPVSYVKIESELFGKKYDVIMTNGFDLEFNGKGEWTEVDGHKSAIPEGIIPAKIAAYKQKKYADQKTVSIKKDRKEYELKLSSGLELIFDKNQNFLRFDD